MTFSTFAPPQCVWGGGRGVWMGVGRPCPPIHNSIVTPRHLFLNSFIFCFCFRLKVIHRNQWEWKIPFVVLLLIGQLFVLENHSFCKHRLQYHSKNYVRAYLESWWIILWEQRINKNHFKEHQHNNLSHCIMQIKTYKKLAKKMEDKQFWKKEKW